jgi:hypothetical protein
VIHYYSYIRLTSRAIVANGTARPRTRNESGLDHCRGLRGLVSGEEGLGITAAVPSLHAPWRALDRAYHDNLGPRTLVLAAALGIQRRA